VTSQPSDPPKRKRRLPDFPLGWATLLAPVLVLLVGAYVVGRISAPHHAAARPPHHAAARPVIQPIKFDVPEPALPGNPLPLVGCVAAVHGSGKLSPGYTLLIGNALRGANTYYFQPVSWPQPDRWVSTNYFGVWSDGGQPFKVVAVVMPKALATYLVSAYQANRPPGSPYLAGPGIPPAPGIFATKEWVRRKYYKSEREFIKSGC
jgi:hypothetical protein